MKITNRIIIIITLSSLITMLPLQTQALNGDLLATVSLPSNNGSVGGTTVPVPGGIVYVSPRGFFGNTLDVYTPPLGGLGAVVATLEATKTVVDGGNNPVNVSCIAWDPSRNVMWGVEPVSNPRRVFSINMGDFFADGDVVATFAFNADGAAGSGLCDGVAYDPGSDTLWISPDVNSSVYEFGLPAGGLLNTVTPKNSDGNADGLVSGVVVGSGNTLYIGRNGAQEVRLIDKTTGNFISQFSQTQGRAEDLACDPVTYAPLEAILAKEANDPFYEAFEVEPGTCPLPGDPDPDPVPREHFICYKSFGSFLREEVNLVDQFEDKNFDVLKPKMFCNPAIKPELDAGVELATNPHYLSYKIKEGHRVPRHERKMAEVQNQFGIMIVETIRPDRLMVPSGKSLDLNLPPTIPAPGPNTNHYKCYTVRATGFQSPGDVAVLDQFTDDDGKKLGIVRPTRLCNPVQKTRSDGTITPISEDPDNELDHLMCYSVKAGAGELLHKKTNVLSNNQFREEKLVLKRELEFCVPTKKILLTP
jgi:hypothetical protein